MVLGRCLKKTDGRSERGTWNKGGTEVVGGTGIGGGRVVGFAGLTPVCQGCPREGAVIRGKWPCRSHGISIEKRGRCYHDKGVHDTLPHADDFDLAQRCLEGQESALVELQTTYRPVVVGYLRKNGATDGEAMEIAESLWADLINQRPGRRPRLATYGGMSALATWLYPLAVNRLMARRRREEVERRYVEKGGDIRDLPAPSEEEGCEPFLIQLMKEAIEAGFRACSAEDFVKLQLHHSDEIYYVELGKMFRRGKTSIERDVAEAGSVVQRTTLKYIRDRDPYLQLTWEDFQTLCRVATPACFGTETEE